MYKNAIIWGYAIMFDFFRYGFDLGGFGAMGIVLAVCAILGLIAGIVMLAVFLPSKNRGRYRGAAGWLYDFLNFNKYWITALLKLLNIILAVVCLLGGFICLFIQPIVGLGLMVGYIIYRMLLELVMVTLNIRDNVSNIDDKLSRLGLPGIAPPPANAAAPRNACPNCGSPVQPGTRFCMKCGSPL